MTAICPVCYAARASRPLPTPTFILNSEMAEFVRTRVPGSVDAPTAPLDVVVRKCPACGLVLLFHERPV